MRGSPLGRPEALPSPWLLEVLSRGYSWTPYPPPPSLEGLVFSLPHEAKACLEEGGRKERGFEEEEVIVHLSGMGRRVVAWGICGYQLRTVAGHREQGLGLGISAAVRGERRKEGRVAPSVDRGLQLPRLHRAPRDPHSGVGVPSW